MGKVFVIEQRIPDFKFQAHQSSISIKEKPKKEKNKRTTTVIMEGYYYKSIIYDKSNNVIENVKKGRGREGKYQPVGKQRKN